MLHRTGLRPSAHLESHMDEQHRERVALFRYAAIGELGNGPLAPGDTE